MKTIQKKCTDCGAFFDVFEQFAYGINTCHRCRIVAIEKEETILDRWHTG
ncbi:MAG: hypothetical protein K0A90_00040 [Methanosarcinaceae archaeon]|nr:hypothetical protein [Methanosarcinaceae archaeon]